MAGEMDSDRTCGGKDAVGSVSSGGGEGSEPVSVPTPDISDPDPQTRKIQAPTPRWESFATGGVNYTFEHLTDFEFICQDADGGDHAVLVSFTDHVFTRGGVDADRVVDAFPDCSRIPHGYLCPVRYQMSLRLPELIEHIARQKVWCLSGADRYGQVSVVDEQGVKQLYAVIFTLDRMKGRTQSLRMLIRSAHLCDRKPPDTFGEVKFSNLVKLRIENKHPSKNYGRSRKRPKMP